MIVLSQTSLLNPFLSGEKKEEYREIKPYYETRFANDLIRRHPYSYECPIEAINDIERQEYNVIFKNGYRKALNYYWKF